MITWIVVVNICNAVFRQIARYIYGQRQISPLITRRFCSDNVHFRKVTLCRAYTHHGRLTCLHTIVLHPNTRHEFSMKIPRKVFSISLVFPDKANGENVWCVLETPLQHYPCSVSRELFMCTSFTTTASRYNETWQRSVLFLRPDKA